ncbi:MAG: alpha/beta fold hydrolase [Waddliaceae bacterium]
MSTLLKWKVVIFCVFIQTVFAGCPHKYCESCISSKRIEGYIDVDKGSLYYQSFGHGDPVIVLHGGPGLDQGYLLPQLLALAGNYQLIFYDQRGSGRSLKTELSPEYINIAQFVEDLEVLRKSLGFNKFTLMGHSWGGLLAMQYAIKHRDQLSGLILLSTAPADYEGQNAFASEFGLRTQSIIDEIKPLFSFDDFKKLNAAQISALYRKIFSVYFDNPDKVEELSLNFTVDSARSGYQVDEEMSKTAWLQPSVNLLPDLKKLDVPTLIVHGRQDIIPIWTAVEIHKAIPGSEMAILEECGHFPYIEQPRDFFVKVTDFLSKMRLGTSK